MGEPWTGHPSWELVEEASDASGRDVAGLLLTTDDDELRQTRNAQLATFTLSMVMVDAVNRIGVETRGHAGHSLGEYTALASSGCLDFADAVRLVAERGEAMQVAAEEHEGTMAAVLGLADALVEQAAHAVDDVWVANYNAPGQVVIAGTPSGVEAGGEKAKELGAKRAMALSVGGAFHTPHMMPAQDRLEKALSQTEFRNPDHPIYSNVDASPHSSPEEIAELLGRQLTSPVRWSHAVERMVADGFSTLVEIGPGTALSGMAKRITKTTRNLKVNVPGDLDALLESLGAHDASERVLEGEVLYAYERMVVSPGSGVFTPVTNVAAGSVVKTGQLIGTVGDSDVRTLFNGDFMGYLALPGERVHPAQPIAWLRTT